MKATGELVKLDLKITTIIQVLNRKGMNWLRAWREMIISLQLEHLIEKIKRPVNHKLEHQIVQRSHIIIQPLIHPKLTLELNRKMMW